MVNEPLTQPLIDTNGDYYFMAVSKYVKLLNKSAYGVFVDGVPSLKSRPF